LALLAFFGFFPAFDVAFLEAGDFAGGNDKPALDLAGDTSAEEPDLDLEFPDPRFDEAPPERLSRPGRLDLELSMGANFALAPIPTPLS
jgi:hypothetical protein